jgi:phosphoribosylaminoimidazole-succinocarboxamide synthase
MGEFLRQRGIVLVDFKLEFGLKDGELVLGDEISPDTCRFHDAKTGEIMDKDRFRQDLGGFIEAYNEVLSRVSS